MRNGLELRLAHYLVEQNRPLSLIQIHEQMNCTEADILEVINILTFQGIISQYEFRNYVYITLNLPGYGTPQFPERRRECVQRFLIQHYR